jgi:hypothetical protein
MSVSSGVIAPAVIPSIPQTGVEDPKLRPIVESVRTILNTRAFGKNELDRWVTWTDLIQNNIVRYQSGNTVLSGTPGNFLPVGSDGTDFTPPPQPTGLTATAGVFNIILDWTDASFGNYAYTEIWRSATNTLSSAVLHGTSVASVFSDNVGFSDVTYYYWIRFVSRLDVVGPYHSVTPVSASTGRVGNSQIVNLAITAEKIANGSIDLGGAKIAGLLQNTNLAQITDATKIADSLIGNSKLANLAVDANKLANSSVTSTKIANAAVGTAAIQTAAITNALIANAAVGSAQIQNAAITEAKIGFAAVGAAAIQDGVITNAKIANAAVDEAKIANASIVTAKIADAAITSAKIENAAVTNAKIASAAIQTANIADAAITNAKIQDATILSAKIANGAITNAKIGNIIASANFNGLVNETTGEIGSPGNLGWAIGKSGTAVFNDATFRGTIESTSGTIGGNILTSNSIQSSNYSSFSGWRIRSNGDAVFNSVTIRRDTLRASGTWVRNTSIEPNYDYFLSYNYDTGASTFSGNFSRLIDTGYDNFSTINNPSQAVFVGRAVVKKANYFSAIGNNIRTYTLPIVAEVVTAIDHFNTGSNNTIPGGRLYLRVHTDSFTLPFNLHPNVSSIQLTEIEWVLAEVT